MPHLITPPRPRFAFALPLLGVLAGAVLFHGAPHAAEAAPPGQAGTTTQAASPSAPLSPTATPTPSPADLSLARLLDQQGRTDGAEGAYLAVVAKGTPADRLAARLSLAKIYLSRGSYLLAGHQLDAYLLEAPPGANVRDAQFMQARALSGSGDDTGALPLYSAYLQTDGSLSTYARIGRSESFAATGQTAQAVAEANALLTQDLPPSVRSAFELQMAQALESTSPPDAIDWYGRVRADSSAPSDQALAIWRGALIGGDVGQEYAAWVNVLSNFPDTPTSREIVDKPPPVSAQTPLIDPYNRGLVYYYAGQNDRARLSFEQTVANNEASSGSAYFYLGALDEREGASQDAIDHYAQVTKVDPQSPQADDALWWSGRLLEQAGRKDEAGAAYARIASDYSSSSFADEARFRLALLSYDSARYQDGAKAFEAIAKAGRDDVQQRALLWQGKSLLAAGDDKTARTVLEALRKQTPAGYYGLRAAAVLGEASGSLAAGGVGETPEPDWSVIESWLSSQNSGPPLLAQQALFANPHWGAATGLESLGMTRQASAEFNLLLDRASSNPAMLLELSHYFHSAGLPDLSARAAARLLARLPEATAATAPADLWRLAYPAPFAGAADKAASDENVAAVLLLALVRQESFFDPLAGSTAGAIGLAQIVPSTAAGIAADLKIGPIDEAQLFQPDVSLRFGAYYLRQQLDTFNGNIYAALAAYNAGPGSVLRWQRATNGRDTDRFVAEIEYAQTQSYVKLVIENLARYRQLYQGLAQPALPKD
jgi:soluble lytic murein transglycosylase